MLCSDCASFPATIFLLLPPLIICAARNVRPPACLSQTNSHCPARDTLRPLRPSYIEIARGDNLRDLAMDRDSRQAAAKLRALAQPGDTLFVWGFRPDIFIDSGLPAGTRFLESQSISGVLADRHLFIGVALAPEFTAPNRPELIESRPTWVVDGLGLYNPPLALTKQSELAAWLAQYVEAARTDFSILYRLR